MLQLTPHMKILLAYEPVDFRKGIDSLVALCKAHLKEDPFSGSLFVFRNKSRTAIKLLVYDGQGYWLCLKRLSAGRLQWWPTASAADHDMPVHPLAAQQLSILIYNGRPDQAHFAPSWRKIA